MFPRKALNLTLQQLHALVLSCDTLEQLAALPVMKPYRLAPERLFHQITDITGLRHDFTSLKNLTPEMAKYYFGETYDNRIEVLDTSISDLSLAMIHKRIYETGEVEAELFAIGASEHELTDCLRRKNISFDLLYVTPHNLAIIPPSQLESALGTQIYNSPLGQLDTPKTSQQKKVKKSRKKVDPSAPKQFDFYLSVPAAAPKRRNIRLPDDVPPAAPVPLPGPAPTLKSNESNLRFFACDPNAKTRHKNKRLKDSNDEKKVTVNTPDITNPVEPEPDFDSTINYLLTTFFHHVGAQNLDAVYHMWFSNEILQAYFSGFTLLDADKRPTPYLIAPGDVLYVLNMFMHFNDSYQPRIVFLHNFIDNLRNSYVIQRVLFGLEEQGVPVNHACVQHLILRLNILKHQESLNFVYQNPMGLPLPAATGPVPPETSVKVAEPDETIAPRHGLSPR